VQRQYRRYRPHNSRKRRRNGRSGSSGGYAKALVAFLLIGSLVYFVTAGAAGKWVSDHIVTPVIQMFNRESGIAPPSDSSPPNEENIILDDVSCRILQIGVFSNQPNAKGVAAEAVAAGGAGYVLKDGEQYRVFVAAYYDQETARAVQAKLAQNNIESSVYEYFVEGLDLDVTASQEQKQAILDAFDEYIAAARSMEALCVAFDGGTKDEETVRTELIKLKTALKEKRLAFESVGSNQLIDGMADLMMKHEQSLGAVHDQEYGSIAAMSSALKNAHITTLFDYSGFIASLTDNLP
jgi:hypothetical protein